MRNAAFVLAILALIIELCRPKFFADAGACIFVHKMNPYGCMWQVKLQRNIDEWAKQGFPIDPNTTNQQSL